MPYQSACMVTTKCLIIHFITVTVHHSVVVANTVLTYKLRKLRSHFLSHFIRGLAWRSSVAILPVRSCGTRAELVVCGRAVMRDARPWLIIFAVLSAVLRSGFRDTDAKSSWTWLRVWRGWRYNADVRMGKTTVCVRRPLGGGSASLRGGKMRGTVQGRLWLVGG